MTSKIYDEWLRRQSLDFQKRILKEDTLNRFIAGEAQENFVDENFEPIDLDQLRELDGLD